MECAGTRACAREGGSPAEPHRWPDADGRCPMGRECTGMGCGNWGEKQGRCMLYEPPWCGGAGERYQWDAIFGAVTAHMAQTGDMSWPRTAEDLERWM